MLSFLFPICRIRCFDMEEEMDSVMLMIRPKPPSLILSCLLNSRVYKSVKGHNIYLIVIATGNHFGIQVFSLGSVVA